MTAHRRPSAAQVERALETIARCFGPAWSVGARVPAHVEWLGGSVETFRVYAVDGDRNVLLAQVPRDAYEDGVG